MLVWVFFCVGVLASKPGSAVVSCSREGRGPPLAFGLNREIWISFPFPSQPATRGHAKAKQHKNIDFTKRNWRAGMDTSNLTEPEKKLARVRMYCGFNSTIHKKWTAPYYVIDNLCCLNQTTLNLKVHSFSPDQVVSSPQHVKPGKAGCPTHIVVRRFTGVCKSRRDHQKDTLWSCSFSACRYYS